MQDFVHILSFTSAALVFLYVYYEIVKRTKPNFIVAVLGLYGGARLYLEVFEYLWNVAIS